MVANATVDLTKIISNAESNTKSFADNKATSDNFENVFKSVNDNYKKDDKNYSSDRKSDNTSETNIAKAEQKSKETTTEQTEQFSEKPTDNSVKESQGNTESNKNIQNKDEKSDKAVQNQQSESTNTAENTVAKDEKTPEQNLDQTILPQAEVVTEVIVQNIAVQTPNSNHTNTQKPNNKPVVEENSQQAPIDTELQTSSENNTAEKAQPTANAAQASKNTALSNQPIALTPEFAEALKTNLNATDEQIAKVANDLATRGTARAEAVGAATKNQNNIPDLAPGLVQPQAKTNVDTPSPALANTTGQNSELQNNTTQIPITQNNNTQIESQVQNQTKNYNNNLNLNKELPNTNQQATSQANFGDAASTPVIQATTEVIASNISTEVKTPNTEEALNKTNLTQDIVDKTDAKVTNVEGNSKNTSNHNDLLKKQSPQEQVMRLSLEQNSETTKTETPEINVANIRDTGSMNFAKTIDNVQPQAPKEISKTDIMSQINNQLAPLKEEGTTKVTIVLRPENLGKINIELTNGKDGLVAKMTTENAQVKELLDKSIDSLKDNLSGQGVNVNNVTVKVNETQKQDTMFAFNEQKGQNNQQQPENQNTQKNQETFANQQTFEDDNETLIETSETEIRTENSVSMSSSLGKVDYKI